MNHKSKADIEAKLHRSLSRQVRVQFLSTNAIDMVWDFYPKSDDIVVHPGAVNEMIFIARNPSDHPMSAQAIPR